MLAEAEDMNKAEDEAEMVPKKGKAKTKVGNKNRKKKRRIRNEDGYETDHQVKALNFYKFNQDLIKFNFSGLL